MPIWCRLLEQLMRAAASRTFWTAGTSRPMSTAMIAITTSSSIRVKARRVRRRTAGCVIGDVLHGSQMVDETKETGRLGGMLTHENGDLMRRELKDTEEFVMTAGQQVAGSRFQVFTGRRLDFSLTRVKTATEDTAKRPHIGQITGRDPQKPFRPRFFVGRCGAVVL